MGLVRCGVACAGEDALQLHQRAAAEAIGWLSLCTPKPPLQSIVATARDSAGLDETHAFRRRLLASRTSGCRHPLNRSPRRATCQVRFAPQRAQELVGM